MTKKTLTEIKIHQPSDNPEDSAHLGPGFVWLHAFAIGGYPDWVDSDSEDEVDADGWGGFLVETIREHFYDLTERLEEFSEESVLWRGRTPYKPAEGREIVETAESAIHYLRMSADYVVGVAHDYPDARAYVAEAASLALRYGRIIALVDTLVRDAFTTVGYKSIEGQEARRAQRRVPLPDILLAKLEAAMREYPHIGLMGAARKLGREYGCTPQYVLRETRLLRKAKKKV
jgi:hypothetical protein